MKLGVAFSGGGIKAAAQLGVMKALYEEGIKPEIFVGTSSGSIVATLLALGNSPDTAFAHFKSTVDIIDIAYWHIFKGFITKKDIKGLAKGKRLERILDEIFDQHRLVELTPPYAPPLGIVSTDLISGKQVIFSNSPSYNKDSIADDNYEWVNDFSRFGDSRLSNVVRASCSFPGIYIPKRYGDYIFVDGGVTNNLPSDIAKALGADRVLSIDLGASIDNFKPDGIFSIILRSYRIIYDRDMDNNDKYHDIYINPKVADIGTFEISGMNECFERGYNHGKSSMGLIKNALESGSPITL
jgi:NTE family protein